jgi:hypothetical protein
MIRTMEDVKRRSKRSSAALYSSVAAAVFWTTAFIVEHQNPFLIALIPVVIGGLIALMYRRKAAIVPGAFYASSADLLFPERIRHGKLPGELSFTDTAIHWVPSGYAVRKGASAIMIEIADHPDVTFEKGPGLTDLFLRIRRGNGSDLTFLTHRRRNLNSARERLHSLLAGHAPELERGASTVPGR